MKTQIIVERISLQRKHEIKHFEMRIPNNTDKIIGIEYSIRFQEAFVVADSIQYDEAFTTQFHVADIRLQGATKQTWFYANCIKDSLKSIEEIDFYTENSDKNLPFVFQGKHEIETLNIQPNATRINGFIKDVIGAMLNQDIQYSITICLHVNLLS